MKSPSTPLATNVLSALAFVVVSFGAARASLVQEGPVAYANPRSYYEAHVDLSQPEQARIRAHLASVEAVLRARPTDGLTDEQKRNRLARLDDLRAYREAGVFPRNLDFPDRLIPYFIDAAGTPCAMGQLIIASGHAALAEDVRVTMNNAYIGEIAAADPRLQEWVDEQGMTLEEAAMVQPAYGAPQIDRALQIRLDSLSRPWVLGSKNGNVSVGGFLAHYDSARWKFEVREPLSFCVTKSGSPLLVGGSQANWNSRDYTFLKDFTSTCEWSANDSVAWVGSASGVTRLRRSGSGDTLASTLIPSPRHATDTVRGIATTPGFVWGISNQGVFRLNASAVDSAPTVWDSVAVWGKRILRIKASGHRVWLGIGDGAHRNSNLFSIRGLRRYNGTGWSAFVASQSSIQTPGDTIYALAVRDTSSIWVATPSFGFARFNGTTTTKVADIPTGVTVYDMVGDTAGFYAGTSNGIYRFTGGALMHFGIPSSILRPDRNSKRNPLVPGLTSRLRGTVSGEGGVVTIQGRQAGPRQAAGVYYVPAPLRGIDGGSISGP